MRILIAADSFKESLTAAEACSAMAAGFQRALPAAEITCCPMADGGEGTSLVMHELLGGERITCRVQNALGEPVDAKYTLLPDGAAVIEMAAAAGLDLIARSERDVKKASTFGVGQLMAGALERGAKRIIIGLGGSATNDGGAGMLQALGVNLQDSSGNTLPAGGAALAELAVINAGGLDARWQNVEIIIASDVNNPLCGARGASAVFGPQKGAQPEDVALLDNALAHFAGVCEAHGLPAHKDTAGAGAAGGLGFALLTFFNSRIESGIDIVMQAASLAEKIASADIVVTGEGKMDGQTGGGKVPHGVSQVAKAAGVPCVAICGSLDKQLDGSSAQDYLAVFSSVMRVESFEDVLAGAASSLEYTAGQIGRLLTLSKK